MKKGSDDNICVVVVDLRDAAAKANNALQFNTRKRKVVAEDCVPEEPKLVRTHSTAGSPAIAEKVQEHKQKRQRQSRLRSKKDSS